MRIIEKGHRYQLASLDGECDQQLPFVRRFRGVDNHPGTTCQEVLRALIDRVETIDAEVPWAGNQEILALFRRAIVLFETRALERRVEKGELLPERVVTSVRDGHFKLEVES